MDNYKELYYMLFNGITRLAEEMKEMQEMQAETEDMFIEQNPDPCVDCIHKK